MDVVEETLGPLALRTEQLGRGDELQVANMGSVRIAELSTGSSGTASRTAQHVRHLDQDLCKVDVLVSGRAVVQQDEREAPLTEGDFAVVDLSRPARWAMSPARLSAVVFPRALLPLTDDEMARATAVRIAGHHGAAALLGAHVREVSRHLDEYGDVERVRLGTNMIDLLTTALAARLGGGERIPPESGQRSSMLQVVAFIERHLADPGLTPRRIAAANAMSLRSLYNLFEAENESVAGLIKRRRLERCRGDLLDPRRRDPDGERDRGTLGIDERDPLQSLVPRRVWALAHRVPRVGKRWRRPTAAPL